jgi:isoleucyl-tRNA synthetase
MNGFDQRFQNGFDCQGLWVEVEVEKELDFKTKKDIETYGLEKFTNKCKERVVKYSAIQTEQSKRLGMFMDWDNSYYTMSEENNYAIWHFLKKCSELGYLYKGEDVVPWCQRCGTAISQHEILTEEYKELTHASFYVKFPLKDEKNIYFLVWTTTPWTLPANTGLAVGKDIKYSIYKNIETDEKYILAEEIAEKLLKENFEKICFSDGSKTKTGNELLGLEYNSILPEIQNSLDLSENKFKVWVGDFVNTEEGTGIVHIAPGCGKEDFELAKENNIPIINPIKNDEGDYADYMGILSGKNVSHINSEIKDLLGILLFKEQSYTHRYPTCWRCKSELIFRLVNEWYIKMDEIRQKMMEVTKKIKWLPSFGLERELDWLKNMDDWLISKKRYWGLALPIFECECGHYEVIGSKEELKEKSVEGWEKFEGNTPHRPWVDNIIIQCSKCGNLVSRIKDVGNPWLDAGIVPFSTIPGNKTDKENKPTSYFNDRENWEKWFPADFITESFPGQFKNWFYSLIAMSTVLENEPSFKTVLGFASVKDEKGEEMHKSKGNAIWFDEAADTIGVDTMRLLYCLQNPSNNLLFGYRANEEVRRKYILILWNVYSFFVTYSNIDNFKPEKSTKSENLMDMWIMADLQETIEITRKGFDDYNLQKSTQQLVKFIEDLSTWYLRRSRNRKTSEFYQTMYDVLKNLVKLLAPITPFLSESIYQNLKFENEPESVHLCDYPEVNDTFVNKELLSEMSMIRDIVELAHSAREEANIKIRQPLSDIKVYTSIKLNYNFNDILIDELNIKEITFIQNTEIELMDKNNDYIMKQNNDFKVYTNIKITPELLEECTFRDSVRKIQDLRKNVDLKPNQIVDIYYFAENNEIEKFIDKHTSELSAKTNCKLIPLDIKDGKIESSLKVENGTISFYINQKD